MVGNNQFSRRRFIRGTSVWFAASQVEPTQGQPIDGVAALLDGSAMVGIPAGEFLMGSRSGTEDEDPVHRVRISQRFEMGKYEVSQAQWKSVMTDPHKGPNALHPTPEGMEIGSTPSNFKGDSLPVERVSWDDIQVFLRRLNARANMHQYRLPTEAEWEYACNAGKPGEGTDKLSSTAWYQQNSGDQTHPIGQKDPNAWGLYDMLGNVAEWVHDWYGSNYYSRSPMTDPVGPDAGSYRVIRGGGWFDNEKYCRPTYRRFDFPISRLYHVGFRVVRVPKEIRSGRG